MKVPAALLVFGLTLAAAAAVGCLVESFFAYQRSLLRYRCWGVRDEMVDGMRDGHLNDSEDARALIRLAESAVKGAEILTPVKLLSLVWLSRWDEKTVTRSTGEGDLDLEPYHRRLVGAWVRLVMFGSPTGLLVFFAVGLRAVVCKPMAGVLRRRVVQQTVYERLVEPVDVDDFADEINYSNREPLLV